MLSRPLADVTLRAPIPFPPSMRDGYAFRQHVESARRGRGLEMIPEFDRFPVFYFANHRSVIGPGDVAVRPKHLERLDYELEAAVVVGKRGVDLDVQQADEAIFGMTIMNDWSARAMQAEEMKLNLGPAKGKDFATSLGPYLVTIDELAGHATRTDRGTAFDLGMRASVNGRALSRGNVKDMSLHLRRDPRSGELRRRARAGERRRQRDVRDGLLARAQRHEGRPTASGSRVGDVVVLEIDGLGRLENRVVLGGGASAVDSRGEVGTASGRGRAAEPRLAGLAAADPRGAREPPRPREGAQISRRAFAVLGPPVRSESFATSGSNSAAPAAASAGCWRAHRARPGAPPRPPRGPSSAPRSCGSAST